MIPLTIGRLIREKVKSQKSQKSQILETVTHFGDNVEDLNEKSSVLIHVLSL